MKDLITAFAQIFVGYEHAHGQHELFSKPDENGKIKGNAKTIGRGAGQQEYKVHLYGEGTSLGLIPLISDNSCHFGAIDIDIKGEAKLHETVEELESRVRKFELPLVVCRSKSGGAHLYLFGSHPISAKILQTKLTEFAALLGYAGTEVFPKQVMRVNDADLGNWINIPYYGSLSEGGTTRHAIRLGKHITNLEDFCTYAETMRVSQRELQDVVVKLSTDFSDGPPCLQHLATFGLEEGGRNTALTNVAIYYKKKFPEDWQDLLNKFNYDHCKPSLSQSELSQIGKNVSRKDYFYTCKQPPLCLHCDKRACVRREFGVTFGDDTSTFPLDNLTRCVSKDSVRWYAEHQGMRVELTTDQLLSPQELQKIFIERFARVIIPGKKSDWHVKLKEMMETCSEVQDPEDASRHGQFENLLDNFFTSSRPARNKDELIKGNSFTEGGRIYFRSEDLFNYLNVHRFTNTPHEIWTWLRQTDAQTSIIKIKGKGIRVWSLPEPSRYDGSEIALPSQLETEL
jgi:hypothetical protein